MLRLIKEINAMYWSCAGVHFLKSWHHQQSYGSTPECKVIVICDGNMIMEVLLLSIIVMAYWQPWRPSIGGSYLKLTKVAINGPLRRLFCVRNILYAIKHFVTLDSRLLTWPLAKNSPTNTGPRTTFWMFRSKMLPCFTFLACGAKGPSAGQAGTIWAKGGKVRVMRPLLLRPMHGSPHHHHHHPNVGLDRIFGSLTLHLPRF